MADSPQDENKELLTERELEAVHALAREIVREAGNGQDQVHEMVLEVHRAELDLSKSMLLLKVGLITGMGAVAALLPQEQGGHLLLFSMLAFAVLSLIAEVLYMRAKVSELQIKVLEGFYVRRGSMVPDPRPRWVPQWVEAIAKFGVSFGEKAAWTSLLVALVLFVVYIGSNAP